MKGQENYRALVKVRNLFDIKKVEDIDGLELFPEALPRTWTINGQTREIGVIRLGKWKDGDVILVFDNRNPEHWERVGKVLGRDIASKNIILQN